MPTFHAHFVLWSQEYTHFMQETLITIRRTLLKFHMAKTRFLSLTKVLLTVSQRWKGVLCMYTNKGQGGWGQGTNTNTALATAPCYVIVVLRSHPQCALCPQHDLSCCRHIEGTAYSTPHVKQSDHHQVCYLRTWITQKYFTLFYGGIAKAPPVLLPATKHTTRFCFCQKPAHSVNSTVLHACSAEVVPLCATCMTPTRTTTALKA